MESPSILDSRVTPQPHTEIIPVPVPLYAKARRTIIVLFVFLFITLILWLLYHNGEVLYTKGI